MVAAAGGSDHEDRRGTVKRRAATAVGLMIGAGVWAGPAKELPRVAVAAGVEFRWMLEGHRLYGCMADFTYIWAAEG